MEKKLNSFVEKVIAMRKGDDNVEKVERMFKRAKSCITIAIADTKNDILKIEDQIEDDKIAFEDALHNNGSLEIDDNQYIVTIVECQNKENEDLNSLDKKKAQLKYYTELLKRISE